MKYCVLFSIAIFFPFTLVFSQGKRSIRVKAGDDLAQAYSPQGFYRFPQFSKAVLYFHGVNGNSGPLFNYNVLSGNMQFISPAKDTLDMANTATLDSIVFDQTVFYHNRDGFMEVLASSDSVKLLKKLVIKAQVESIGAYGLSNNTSSIASLKSFYTGTGVFNLVVNQDVVLEEFVNWFFASGNNVVKANKSNLLKLLSPDKGAKAESYLKQNKINFEKEEDLKKLVIAIGG